MKELLVHHVIYPSHSSSATSSIIALSSDFLRKQVHSERYIFDYFYLLEAIESTWWNLKIPSWASKASSTHLKQITTCSLLYESVLSSTKVVRKLLAWHIDLVTLHKTYIAMTFSIHSEFFLKCTCLIFISHSVILWSSSAWSFNTCVEFEPAPSSSWALTRQELLILWNCQKTLTLLIFIPG